MSRTPQTKAEIDVPKRRACGLRESAGMLTVELRPSAFIRTPLESKKNFFLDSGGMEDER